MAVRCRAGAVTNAGVWYGPGSAEQREERCTASGTRVRNGDYFDPNALKVMMVWVSWIPGIVWTFSLTKWPMSVSLST